MVSLYLALGIENSYMKRSVSLGVLDFKRLAIWSDLRFCSVFSEDTSVNATMRKIFKSTLIINNVSIQCILSCNMISARKAMFMFVVEYN